MQANNGSIIATVIICAILLGGLGIYAVNQIPEVPEMPVIPTAQEIVDLIVIPSFPVVDTDKIDRVCELTDGCEYWEKDKSYTEVINHFNLDRGDMNEDFKEAMSDLLDIDEEYLNIIDFDERDTQVRAYSDKDKEDDNWKIKVFAKVNYEDDEQETEYVYVLVTSTLDEGEYESMTVEEVSRNFEFD